MVSRCEGEKEQRATSKQETLLGLQQLMRRKLIINHGCKAPGEELVGLVGSFVFAWSDKFSSPSDLAELPITQQDRTPASQVT